MTLLENRGPRRAFFSGPARPRAPIAALAPLLFVAALGVSCRTSQSANATECQLVSGGFGPQGAEPIGVETVASGLEVPWALAQLPSGDLLVTERQGRIRLIRQGEVLPTPVATIPSTARAEGGLLGLVLHPDFSNNGLFYLYFTARTDGTESNRVERWKLAPSGTSATRDRAIIEGIPAAPFHDGGRLRFGPDRMLYIGTGDATEPSAAQDRGSLAGKLLRVTPDGGIPQDNPWPGIPAFVIGIRNTQGFDWTETGALFVTDHGPSGEMGRSGHDELNLAAPGANLGWPNIYGCQGRAGMVAPLLTWREAVPPGGAAFYRGKAIPEWRGHLLIATLGSQHLHRVQLSATEPLRVAHHAVYLEGADGPGRLREVYMAPDGELYLTTSNCDGRGSCPPTKDRVLRLRGR
jgi:glucose/arabinose dehydrogenase